MKNKIGLKRTKNKTRVYCYDPRKSKMVHAGDVIGLTYVKVVNQKMFMRVVNGWGIQQEVFEALAELDVENINIKDLDNQCIWTTTYDTYKEHSKAADYGNGKQVFLSMKYYELKIAKGRVVNETSDKISVFEALRKQPIERIEEMQRTLFDS